MTASDPQSPLPQSESHYEVEFLAKYGELMDAHALRTLLGIEERTFRRAAHAQRLPIRVFRIPGRRGWFARTRDLAAWLGAVGGVASVDVPPDGLAPKP